MSTQNYTPRFEVSIPYYKHGEQEPAGFDVEYLDSKEGLDLDGATVRDLALDKRASTKQGRRDRGYYGLPFTGKSLSDLDHHMTGVIDRLTDQALDRLEAL